MIYVSYCAGEIYKEVINKYLLPSLKKWNLSYDIDYISSKGNWMNNIQYKPTFILNMLKKHKQPIISLDADAQIIQYPILFNNLQNYDIAVHYLNSSLQWQKVNRNQIEALGGTLYFNYNEKVLEFVNEWIKIQKKENIWAQKVMQNLLIKYKDKLNIYHLPYSYSVIVMFDYTLPIHMIKSEDIIILHNQVSRKYKKKIQ